MEEGGRTPAMASDAHARAPIRPSYLDSTADQLPPQAYPQFKSSKGATAVASYCSLRRMVSILASVIATVILTVVVIVVVRRASSGKGVLTGKPASPSPRQLLPPTPRPEACKAPARPQPGVTVLDQLLTASGVPDSNAESRAKSWTPTSLPPGQASPSTPTEYKDVILLRFSAEFDPMLKATLARLKKAAGGRRLLASDITENDIFATVQEFKAKNGFMDSTVLGLLMNSTLTNSTLPKLPGMVEKWYYSAYTRTMVLNARTKLGSVARGLLETLPKGRLEFIEYAKSVHKTQAVARPNDPDYAFQWALPKIGVVPATGTTTPSGQVPAWAVTQGTSEIVVAVLDSGIDYTHPDLAKSMWMNPGEIADNEKDDDGNGYIDDVFGFDFVTNDNDPMDDDGHGSHCAGIIAAQASNKVGIAGVAPNVKLMALKVLNAAGVGRTDNQILAHDYAMRMGAHISSNSYGGDSSNDALETSLASLASKGILFVASAGNEARDTDTTPSYPASSDHPNIISVAATDENDCIANFSNYGAQTVDLAAPGNLILSTVPTDINADQYLLMSGTSQAAPHVAAVAALVLSEMAAQKETITGQAEKVKQILLDSAEPVATLKGALVTGGRLDAAKAVAMVRGGAAGRRRRLQRRMGRKQ